MYLNPVLRPCGTGQENRTVTLDVFKFLLDKLMEVLPLDRTVTLDVFKSPTLKGYIPSA